MSEEVLIRYRYPGITNGQPVGDVYVTGPHFGRGVYSHTYNVDKAARWADYDTARAEASQRYWRNFLIVPVAEAVDLKPPAAGAADA